MYPDKTPEKQKITIVGTGNVANVLAALLAVRNRELPENQKIEISILGREEDSRSYKTLKENGIILNFKNSQDDGKVLRVDPQEFKIITANPEDIKDQDHIFVTTKTYAYNLLFFQILNKLKKLSPQKGSETTVVLAQNGIPCWFLSHTDLHKVSLKSVDPFNEMLTTIGLDNVVGCVLNLACNSQVDESTGITSYDVYTPLKKIGIPIGKPDNSVTENIRNLKLIFNGAGIDVATRGAGISVEVLLKLQVNIAINALTALLDCDIGFLLDDKPLKKVVEKLAFEVSTVASAVSSNVKMREGQRLTDRLSMSREHITSTREDFNKGRPLEISIYDAVLELRSHLSQSATSVETIVALTDILKIATKNRDQGMTPDAARESVKKHLNSLVEYVGLSYRPETPTTAPAKGGGVNVKRLKATPQVSVNK